VEGVVGHPALAQSDFNALVFLVNGRLIQDRALVKAVKDGFDSTLKFQEMPVGVISIKIPPAEVDVNVHPQKSEVRFVNSQGVFLAVREGVASAVRRFNSPVAGITESKQPEFWAKNTPISVHAAINRGSQATAFAPSFSNDAAGFQLDGSVAFTSRDSSFGQAPAAGTEPSNYPEFSRSVQTELIHRSTNVTAPNFSFSSLRFVGQIMYCYLLCESADSLVVVDMHAAHERYNFNLIRNSYLNGGISVQELLVPVTIHLGKEGVANLGQNAEYLKRFGIEVEPYGPTSIVIRAVPPFLKGANLEGVIRELAAESYEGLPNSVQGAIDRISARLACHSSIRSGDKLSPEAVRSLFQALDSTEFSAACPHGRPVVVSFNEGQIERWFGRDR
jgi:DNA mismatch repair protein MutL